jgi:hypothetical protein
MQLAKGSIVLSALVVAAGACTFGGLADYAIDMCDPAATQSADPCDRLNAGDATRCDPYVCDGPSRHCVRGKRDDDRDGDSPLSCGGTDCDDKDAKKSGVVQTETCDELDNNCNGFADEGVVVATRERAAFAPGSVLDPLLVRSGDAFVASWVNTSGGCLSLGTLGAGGGQLVEGGCSLLVGEPSVLPRMPYALQVGGGYGATYVSTGGCAGGALDYRKTHATVTSATAACDAAHPVALPAFAAISGTNVGAFAWYEVPYGKRIDPINGCATAASSPLRLVASSDLNANGVAASEAKTLGTATAIRAPALLSVAPLNGILLASPLEGDVGVWLLTQTSMGDALPARIPSLANARSVAIALEGTHLAIAAEIGCSPAASIALVLGTVDVASKSITFEATAHAVAPSSKVATSPSVEWIDERKEWWVSWIDEVPHARVRRFTEDGREIGDPVDAAGNLVQALVGGSAGLFGYDPVLDRGSYVEEPVGCK